MPQPRKIAQNTILLTLGMLAQKIVSSVYFWYYSNNLPAGSIDAGRFLFALSFTALFAIVADFGLAAVLTREASRQPASANSYLNIALAIKIPLSFLSLIFLFIAVNFFIKEDKTLLYFAGLIMFFDNFNIIWYAILRSQQKFIYESLAVGWYHLIVAAIGVISIKLSGNVLYLLVALLSASVVNFIYGFLILIFKLGFKIKPRFDRTIIKHFLKTIPVFALAGIFIKIYNTAGDILLKFLGNYQLVGLYGVPIKIITALQMLIPMAMAAVLYPAFSNYFVSSQEKLKNAFQKACYFLIIFSLPISAAAWALGDKIILTLWPDYLAVSDVFKIMFLAVPFIFLCFPTGHFLNAVEKQKITTINRGILVAASLGLNFLLIPMFGLLGAGITFLISNALIFFLDLWPVNKALNLDKVYFLKVILKTLLASGAMYLFLIYLEPKLPLVLLILFGALIYLAVLYLARGINLAEIKKEVWGRKSINELAS